MTVEARAPRVPSQARIAFRAAGRSVAASARSVGRRLAATVKRVAAFTSPVTGVVSTTGWLVLGAVVASFALEWGFGWVEFAFLGATLAAAVLGSVPFVFGRMQFRVDIALQPSRVVAGERALGQLIVENVGSAPSIP